MQDIESLIEHYTPSTQGLELLASTRVVLLVGITGAGKNTILNMMMETGKFHDMVTSVTREPRMNNGVMEQDGVDYHFLTSEQALKKIKAGEYVEVSPVHGRIYGVTVDEVQRAHDAGKIAVADIDVQGVEKYKKVSDDVTAIFLLPPSYEEWQRRARLRYASEDEFLADWPNRRDSAVKELTKALETPHYHFVINDDIDEAFKACMQISESRDKFYRKDDEMRLVARDILDVLNSHK